MEGNQHKNQWEVNMKKTFEQWFGEYGSTIPTGPPTLIYDCRKAWDASRASTLTESKELIVEASDKAHRHATEEAINACISYVKSGTGDFVGMPHGLVTYFKQQVDNIRKV